MVGGLAAVVAKSAADRFFPEHKHGAPAMLPEKASDGHSLVAAEEEVTVGSLHWGYGALAGAAYGGVAEYFPTATAKDGASFGLTLATISSRLAGAAEEQTTKDKTSAMATHVVYGLVTETVRRFVRKRLG
jgi:putative membrane protein